jgi:hypothetical protein
VVYLWKIAVKVAFFCLSPKFIRRGKKRGASFFWSKLLRKSVGRCIVKVMKKRPLPHCQRRAKKPALYGSYQRSFGEEKPVVVAGDTGAAKENTGAAC